MVPKMKILIADDYRMVATGVEAILLTNDSFEIAGVVENGLQVLDFLIKESVDLVVMDINMPEMDGIQCTKQIKESYPHIKVIILTMYNRKRFIGELISVGADGCVLKSNSGLELITAIQRAMDGKTYYDHVNEFIDHSEQKNEYQLSDREIEIIVLISENYTSKEISEQLFISEHTVKTHRKNIFRKAKVTNSDELVQLAINQKLI